jgi:hypothetical protein
VAAAGQDEVAFAQRARAAELFEDGLGVHWGVHGSEITPFAAARKTTCLAGVKTT